MLLFRPGTGAMHRLPDALSRNPECRDALNLARIGDWTKQRHIIKGVQATITEGSYGDEDPPPYVFDITELGEPIPFPDVKLAFPITFPEETTVKVDFFDNTGRILTSQEHHKVTRLIFNQIKSGLRALETYALAIRKCPSDTVVYATSISHSPNQ